jgi:hypothetical protein
LRNHVLWQVSASAQQQSGIDSWCHCCDCYLTTDHCTSKHMAYAHCACAPMYLSSLTFLARHPACAHAIVLQLMCILTSG